MVTRLLNTTIQLGLCVRSKSRLAKVGMDTLGSSVHRRRSENKNRRSPLITRKSRSSGFAYNPNVCVWVRSTPRWWPYRRPWPILGRPTSVSRPESDHSGSVHWPPWPGWAQGCATTQKSRGSALEFEKSTADCVTQPTGSSHPKTHTQHTASVAQ